MFFIVFIDIGKINLKMKNGWQEVIFYIFENKKI